MRKKWKGDFPGSPVVMTPCFQCRGMSSIPGQGTKIPHYSWHGQKKKKKKRKKLEELIYLIFKIY